LARRRDKGKDIHGILLLDKPAGVTSNQALQAVKRLTNANKVGHTGSLDPLATGLLPLCFGEATKISNFLLNADKVYHVSCKLGVRTNSADADGEIIKQATIPVFDEPRLQQVLAQFMGEIQQIPPMHSAIKQNGTPLYKLAHQGIEVKREPRTVTIHRLQLTDRYVPQSDSIHFEVAFSKGTYVRTLVDEIGQILGCGAHVTRLRRVQAGPFKIEDSVSLDELETRLKVHCDPVSDFLTPIENALSDCPHVVLANDASFYIQQGQAVFVPQLKQQGFIRLYNANQGFIGIGVVLEDGRVAPKRLMNIAKIS
jgi:tRNA pseudouridine55 synthase